MKKDLLEAYKLECQEAKEIIAELEFKNNKYKEKLKLIRQYLSTLSPIDSDFINTETYLRIQTIIKEQ